MSWANDKKIKDLLRNKSKTHELEPSCLKIPNYLLSSPMMAQMSTHILPLTTFPLPDLP